MKILFANKFFYLNGGSERVFFQQRKFFADSCHEIIDFSMHDMRNFKSLYSEYFVNKIDYESISGIGEKIRIATNFVHSFDAVSKLSKLLSKERPQVAHLHNIYHQLTPSIIPLLKQYDVKVVLTLHDYKLICPAYNALNNLKICNECEGRYFGKPLTRNCQKSLFRGFLLSFESFWHKWKGSYDAVDMFIAPSKFMASQISQRIPSDKIRVIANGIDTNEYLPHYLDKGYGLYFGRISKEKGVETMLKAHSMVKNSFPFKVVGTGPLEEGLRASYPDVEFYGHKSGSDLSELVANSAFVVVPSEWYENCSMVVLEAMAFGKPVIGSRIGGLPEQIDDGKTGFLFEMGNAQELAQKMVTLAENQLTRESFGKAGRAKLEEKYSFSSHGKELLKLYKYLLQYLNP